MYSLIDDMNKEYISELYDNNRGDIALIEINYHHHTYRDKICTEIHVERKCG